VRRKAVLAVVLASGAGFLGAGAVASSASSSTHTATPTVITVVTGKPSELAFQLSKSSNLPVGTYTFKVTDKGVGFHTFKFCTTPVKTAAKNTCTGKVTKTLHPGQTASFTVKITKTGKYEYLCSIPGHAAGGMKGLIGIGVAVKPAPKPPATTTPTGTTTSPTTTTTGGAPEANGCPAGTPAGTTIGSDEDGDESGAQPDDGDGCL
jgi:plastocyanin